MIGEPWHRRDLPWADALLDIRHEADLTPLPAALPEPVPDRSVTLGEWQALPHVVAGGPKGGSTSVLVLHAPDGWRGAVALAQYSGRRFAFGGLRRVLPYLGWALTRHHTDPERRRLFHTLAETGLPMLRAALDAPSAWLDPAGPVDGLAEGMYDVVGEHILRWASCRVRAEDVAVLEEHGIEPITSAAVPAYSRTVFPADLMAWHDAGFEDPHEVAAWAQAGCRTPAWARKVQRYGFTPALARDWTATPMVPLERPRQAWAFIDAGWTPAAVRRLGAQTNRRDMVEPPTFYQLVEAWAEAMHPARASAYLCAGWPLEAATRAEHRGEGADGEALALMAALLDEPTHWHVPPHLRGAPVSPHHRAAPAQTT